MEGSADIDWDVDQYKSDHEPKHHWELRRKFMEVNKGRYSEERLVSLGQVFANVEFMGCRYPRETMELVEELSYGIVQDYRESQKNRLKRTFVSGSDAASGKVNRGRAIKRTSASASDSNKTEEQPPSKVLKSDFIIVRLDYEQNENPCNVLNRSAGFCKTSISWTDIKQVGQEYQCFVKINDQSVHSASGATKIEARDAACKETLETLDRKCFTIMVKNKFKSADGSTIDAQNLEEKKEKKPEVQGIGHKLLKMMGWKEGGGLGKGGSGISEPITAQTIVNREGLGCKSASGMFKKQIRKIIEDYAASDNPYDLVFTSGFDNDQRKEMHIIAKRFGLKSKSFGKNEDRFITISRKFDAQQLIEQLKNQPSEKYELIPPENK